MEGITQYFEHQAPIFADEIVNKVKVNNHPAIWQQMVCTP